MKKTGKNSSITDLRSQFMGIPRLWIYLLVMLGYAALASTFMLYFDPFVVVGHVLALVTLHFILSAGTDVTAKYSADDGEVSIQSWLPGKSKKLNVTEIKNLEFTPFIGADPTSMTGIVRAVSADGHEVFRFINDNSMQQLEDWLRSQLGLSNKKKSK